MIKLSTALRGAMVGDYGLRAMMYRGRILVYSGEQPPNADNAPNGTLLARITQEGLTAVPGSQVGGLLLTPSPSTPTLITHEGNWVLKGVAAGTPGWWRFVWNLNDPGTASPSFPRIDGSVADTVVNLPSSVTGSTEISGVQFNLFYQAQL
jgi:hypothetical protein